MTLASLFVESSRWPVLLVAPLAAVALALLERARVRRLVAAIGPRARVLARDPRPARRALRTALFGLGGLLVTASTLHPVVGDAREVVDERGVDLVVCLDVSRSMLARDVAPDRLTRAKGEIHALTRRVGADRLALVVFAGEARTLVPLTRDLRTFDAMVADADPRLVEKGGTDLAAALDAADGVLTGGDGVGDPAASERGARAIVLVTDGEDHEGRGLAAAARRRERAVAVHVVGIGTRLGSKIALEADGGERYLTDRGGADVISRLDADGLARLAEAGGGAFADAGGRGESLVGLYEDRIVPEARARRRDDLARRREDRYQWPLCAGLLCLLGALALPARRRS